MAIVGCKKSVHGSDQYYVPSDTVIKLRSLENERIKVKITYNFANDRAYVELNPNVKITLKGFRSLPQGGVKVLDNKFLGIQYELRGGTGVRNGRYAIFCCSKGKLYKSMDVASLSSFIFKDTYVPSVDSLHLYDENSLYQLNFGEITEKNNSFELTVSGITKIHSKINPGTNCESQDTTHLHFDNANKIFYTGHITLNGTYVVISDEILNESVNFSNKSLPLLDIDQMQYIFFKNRWFSQWAAYHLEQVDYFME